jgi:hypothetical protein
MNYEKKYLKYKKKYLDLNKQRGGGVVPETPDGFKIKHCNPTEYEIPCVIQIPKLPRERSQWVITRPLTSPKGQEGAFGDMYLGYLPPKEDIKIIKLNILDTLQVTEKVYSTNKIEHIENEICLQNIAANVLEISPKIEDYWICENAEISRAVIIMEKVGSITLNEYLNQVFRNMDNSDYDEPDKIKQLYNLYIAFYLSIALFMKLNQSNIIHGDSHFNNIMLTLDDKNNVVQAHIIDYGRALDIRNVSVDLNTKINENINAGEFKKNPSLIKEFNDFFRSDLEKMLNNPVLGIKIKINEFKQEEQIGINTNGTPIKGQIFINRLKHFCDTLQMNSIFLYYTYLVISDNLEEVIASFDINKTNEDINYKINDMRKDIQFLMEKINAKIYHDIDYIIKFGGSFKYRIDIIKKQIDIYYDKIVNTDDKPSVWLKNIMASSKPFHKKIIEMQVIP